jgi:citrate lyase subunit beta/citryl-CoA lyase
MQGSLPETSVRPRRSVLYMPGSNARALDKAKTLPADGLILDLEDAVAADAKAVARQQVCDAVKAGGYGGRELIIRTNGLDTPWGLDDLAAAAAAGPDAVLLPKVENAALIQQAADLLTKHGAPARTRLWAMMETPKGILHAEAIAASHPRLECLVMGTSDLVKDLNARHTPLRLPVAASLSLCLLAARAYGLAILDGVNLNLDDDAGFKASCEQGLEYGFDGKTLIHPKQVEPCNAVYAPSAAEVEYAHKIIAAFEAATAEGTGVVLVDGKLIENLHVAQAKKLTALAAAIDKLRQA